MVASSHPLATQIGIDVLKKGGNAIDAAIAVNAALGLMEPTGCGIGGDLFAIVWDPKTKKLHGLNASGPSPQTLSLDFFLENNYEVIPYYGALSVSVPGAVAGWMPYMTSLAILQWIKSSPLRYTMPKMVFHLPSSSRIICNGLFNDL